MAINDLSDNLSRITEALKGYFNSRIDLLKLDLLQKTSRAGVYLLTFISVMVSILAVTVFLMFSFSFWYGDKTGNLAEGFLISAAFFLLVLILVYLLRKAIFSRTLIKVFSQILFSEEDNQGS